MDSGCFPSQQQQLTVCSAGLGQQAAILTKPCNSHNEVQINHSSLPKETNLLRTFCFAFYVGSYDIKPIPTFLQIHNSDLLIAFVDWNTFKLSLFKSNFILLHCVRHLMQPIHSTARYRVHICRSTCYTSTRKFEKNQQSFTYNKKIQKGNCGFNSEHNNCVKLFK